MFGNIIVQVSVKSGKKTTKNIFLFKLSYLK